MNALKKRRLYGAIPTQREVARALGVTSAAVNKWESGTSKPRTSMLPSIAKLYGCTVDELLNDNSDKNEEEQDE